MKKTITKILANSMLLVHTVVVLILLFGWSFNRFYGVYIFTLFITFFTQLFLDYCILTKWEFDLRKKLNPSLDYDYSFLSWYAYKYSNINIPSKVIKYISLVFLFVSIVIFFLQYI